MRCDECDRGDRLGERGAPALPRRCGGRAAARAACQPRRRRSPGALPAARGARGLSRRDRTTGGTARRPALEAGLAVVHVHPNALAAARARYQLGGRQVGRLRRLPAGRARTYRHAPAARDRARLRRDEGPAGAHPRPPRAGAGAHLACQPAARRAGALLAGHSTHLRRPRLADRARPLRALPEPRGRTRARREAPATLSRAAALQRTALARGAAPARAQGAAWPQRRARAGGTTDGRAAPGRRFASARRGHPTARLGDRPPRPRPPRRRHLPLALPRPQEQASPPQS